MKKIILMVLVFLLLISACNYRDPASSGLDDLSHRYLIVNTGENQISVQVPRTGNDAVDTLVQTQVREYFSRLCAEDFLFSYTETSNLSPIQEANYTNFYINVQYSVAYSTPEIYSIVFSGILNRKNAAHPVHVFFTVNIDPETGEQLYLKDMFAVDQNMYEIFSSYAEEEIILSAGKWPAGWGSFSEELCSEDAFISGFQDEIAFFSYYTSEGLGISYPVPYVLGNHREVIIPYTELKEAQ